MRRGDREGISSSTHTCVQQQVELRVLKEIVCGISSWQCAVAGGKWDGSVQDPSLKCLKSIHTEPRGRWREEATLWMEDIRCCHSCWQVAVFCVWLGGSAFQHWAVFVQLSVCVCCLRTEPNSRVYKCAAVRKLINTSTEELQLFSLRRTLTFPFTQQERTSTYVFFSLSMLLGVPTQHRSNESIWSFVRV